MVVVCLLLCLVVIMQRPKQEGLGAAFGGGMTDQAFGARTTDVLQKGTVYLGVLFFVITFTLSLLVTAQNSTENDKTLIEEKKEAQVADAENVADVNKSTEEAPAPPAEAPASPAEAPAPPAEAPTTPAAPAEGSPAAPSAPTGPAEQ